MTRPEEFHGVIRETHHESTPWFPTRPHPGPDAPNVVVILLDDLGFSQFGCYGSDIDTRHIDRLARDGLRYTNFHVTPLCSPTRAALLTGRNHHEVGVRAVSNFVTGFPNTRGHVSNHAATVAEVLRDEGYATFCVGKWHLTPMEDASLAGPFDQWPLQRGFNRFYGFLDGETDQFAPSLTYDNHRVDPPATAAEGYHLSEDLVDRSIEFIHDSKSLRPDRPFFLYLAFGATHAPHQAPQPYLDKYRGRYDEGWDVARERWFRRQLDDGLLPAGTELAPRNPGVEAWEDLPEDHRRLAARLQEAFAAFLDHTDDQIGRLVDDLAQLGELDDTLVFVLSDNGASQEGGPHGVLHEWKLFNLMIDPPEQLVAHIDDIGGPHSHTNYPWGWAQAGNTPFKWYKQNTHEGGVHVPLVLHWPAGIRERGGVRRQFHHVNDVVPTIYEVVGVEPPPTYKGLEQIPVTGTSLRYTFDAQPDAPSRKAVQYFEMLGHRAIYADGWKAVTRHQSGTPYDEDRWELYHVAEDPSECRDLAGEHPDRLRHLVERWWEEARAHDVLPLDDRTVELFGARFADGTVHPESRRYVYRPPLGPLPAQASAAIGGRSFDIVADVDRTGGGEGVLYAFGTENGGVSLFVQGDRLVFAYNFFGEHHVAESERPVPGGPCRLAVEFRRIGRSAEAHVLVDGERCGAVSIPRVMSIISSVGSSVGFDDGSPVSDRYAAPFAFSGRLDELLVDVAPGREAPDDADDLSAARAAQELYRQ